MRMLENILFNLQIVSKYTVNIIQEYWFYILIIIFILIIVFNRMNKKHMSKLKYPLITDSSHNEKNTKN